MIHFKCTKCGQDIEAPEELPGKAVKCPNCGLHETAPKARSTKTLLVAIIILLFYLVSLLCVGYYEFTKGRKYGIQIGWREAVESIQAISDLRAREKTNKQTSQQYSSDLINDNIYIDDFEMPRGFSCCSLQLRPDYSKKTCDVIGEMTNNSGKSYTMANFNISVYDQRNVLIDIGSIMIANFNNKQTKSFRLLSGLDKITSTIDSCKIDFESGL